MKLCAIQMIVLHYNALYYYYYYFLLLQFSSSTFSFHCYNYVCFEAHIACLTTNSLENEAAAESLFYRLKNDTTVKLELVSLVKYR